MKNKTPMKGKRVEKKVKAYGIAKNGYMVFDLISANHGLLGSVWRQRRLADNIAFDWANATDDEYKVIPLTISFILPKKKQS